MSEKRPTDGERSSGWLSLLMERAGITPKNASMLKLLAVGLAIGVLLLQSGEWFGIETRSSGNNERPPDATLVAGSPRSEEDELSRLERKYAADLEAKLSLIQGAGDVKVLVTLESGPSIAVVKNTTTDSSVTTEKAADDSTRETQSTNTREDHVFYRDGSAERPVIARTSRPEIAGVLIVAEGARSARLRVQLLDAAMTALNIPANRIEVVAAKKGE